jgi:hypothetical protein
MGYSTGGSLSSGDALVVPRRGTGEFIISVLHESVLQQFPRWADMRSLGLFPPTVRLDGLSGGKRPVEGQWNLR